MPEVLRPPVETSPAPAPRAAMLNRVLYAAAMNPALKFGSLEEQMLELGRAFRAQGGLFLPLFICDEGLPVAPEFAADGIPAVCLDLRRFRFGQLVRLVKMIRANGIDLVHWNFTSPLTNPYLLLLSILMPRVKHCFTDHISRILPIEQSRGRVKQALKRALWKRYRKVFCVSDFVMRCLASQNCPTELVRCTHFINVNRFRPDP